MKNDFEYTEEMYKEDKQIAYWTLKHKINLPKELKRQWKNDLIQVALIQLYKARQKFDPNKDVKYMSFATIVAQREMIKYIKKEQKQNSQSLSSEICEDITLEEMIGQNDEYKELESHYTQILKQEIYTTITKKKQLKISTLKEYAQLQREPKKELAKAQKIAIEYFVNGLTQTQIREKYKISRQAVNQIILKYKPIIKQVLIEKDLIE